MRMVSGNCRKSILIQSIEAQPTVVPPLKPVVAGRIILVFSFGETEIASNEPQFGKIKRITCFPAILSPRAHIVWIGFFQPSYIFIRLYLKQNSYNLWNGYQYSVILPLSA